MSVSENFENFYRKLHLSDDDEANKTQRFHMITKRLNIDFYSSYSDTNNKCKILSLPLYPSILLIK